MNTMNIDVIHDRPIDETNQKIVGDRAAIYVCAADNRLGEGGIITDEELERQVKLCLTYEVDIKELIVETGYPEDLRDRPGIEKIVEKAMAGDIGLAFICEVGQSSSLEICLIALIDLKMKSANEIKQLVKSVFDDFNNQDAGFYKQSTQLLSFS